MDAYVLIGEQLSGKSSVTRCLTGCGQSKTRLIDTLAGKLNVYTHLVSLQEDKKSPADFESIVNQKTCDAVLFSLRPRKGNGCPDADTYLQYFAGLGWNIVRVGCLDTPVSGITTPLPSGAIQSFPRITPTMTVNELAAQVRAYFSWV